jgi:hypothetical protein
MKCNRLKNWAGSFVFLLFIIFFISFVSADYTINPDEYLTEFNNIGEVCTINDLFFYTDSGENLNFITIYECCDKDQCLKIPFDLQNKKEVKELDIKDVFNINFARENIRSGNLIPSNYFPESFDVCSYFSDKLPEQSRNLAVKAADSVEEFAPKNYQRIYRIVKGAGIATGFISQFELGIFVVGVGCNKLSKQEDEAFFKVAECYNYIQSIESGATHYGITFQTYNCMKEADMLLDQILKSWGQQIKSALNKVANTAKAIWNWGTDLAQGNLSAHLEISETSYEAAQRIKGKLNIEMSYLENPNAFDLSNSAQKRLSEKRYLTQNTYSNLRTDYNLLNNKIPGKFEEFIHNIIYNPNTHYEESRAYLEEAEMNLNLMNNLIRISKYNSALELNDSISLSMDKSLMSYEPVSNTPQKTDFFAIIFWIVIIGGIIFICLNTLKKRFFE